MRVLFLLFCSIPMILTVHAQRPFTQYMCQVSHKHSETAFYVTVGEPREVEVGGWKVTALVQRAQDSMEVSLRRIVNIMDATYERESRMIYSVNAKVLPIQLTHDFAGKSDTFNMTCYPRE